METDQFTRTGSDVNEVNDVDKVNDVYGLQCNEWLDRMGNVPTV